MSYRFRPSIMIAVDPGVNAIGYAAWYVQERYKNYRPLFSGVIKVDAASKKKGPYDRMRYVYWKMKEAFKSKAFTLQTLVCETPILFGGAVGQAVAARGDLCNLAASVGMIAAYAFQESAYFVPVTVSGWKGQLPKAIVNKRIKRILKKDCSVLTPKESHDWDACGIGLWALGVFK